MKKGQYSYKNYLECIEYIESSYNIPSFKIHDNLWEFFFEPGGSFVRLMFDEENLKIMISFNVASLLNDSILFMANICSTWKHVQLAPVFYIDLQDCVYIGKDAENQWMIDIEEQILNAFLNDEDTNDPILELYIKMKMKNKVFLNTNKTEALEYFLRMERENTNKLH